MFHGMADKINEQADNKPNGDADQKSFKGKPVFFVYLHKNLSLFIPSGH